MGGGTAPGCQWIAARWLDRLTRASATVGESLEPTRLNGNNVNLDTETLSSIDTMLRYQFATQAVNGSFASVRTALRTTS